jgi:hypothetical protein
MDKIAKNTARYWLVAAFVVGFFAVGVPYWQIPLCEGLAAGHLVWRGAARGWRSSCCRPRIW